MNNLKTMAVLITEDNYSVAAACLPAGFAANRSMKEKIGAYLIINELRCITDFRKARKDPHYRPILAIENKWLDKKRFEVEYRFVDPKEFGETFAEVEKID